MQMCLLTFAHTVQRTAAQPPAGTKHAGKETFGDAVCLQTRNVITPLTANAEQRAALVPRRHDRKT
eukprot:5404407-Lingulodinium_polyedra.AAC.1